MVSSDDMPALVYLPPLFLTTGIPRRPADAQTSDAIDAGQCGALTARIRDDDGVQSSNLGDGSASLQAHLENFIINQIHMKSH